MHVYKSTRTHTHTHSGGGGEGHGSGIDILGRKAREELTDKATFE